MQNLKISKQVFRLKKIITVVILKKILIKVEVFTKEQNILYYYQSFIK